MLYNINLGVARLRMDKMISDYQGVPFGVLLFKLYDTFSPFTFMLTHLFGILLASFFCLPSYTQSREIYIRGCDTSSHSME